MARVREVTGGGAEVVVDTTPYAPRSLASHVPGVNPIHLAIVPGAPRVVLPR